MIDWHGAKTSEFRKAPGVNLNYLESGLLIGIIKQLLPYQKHFIGGDTYASLEKARPVICAKHFIYGSALVDIRQRTKAVVGTNYDNWKYVSGISEFGKVICIVGINENRSCTIPIKLLIREQNEFWIIFWKGLTRLGIAKSLFLGWNCTSKILPRWKEEFETNREVGYRVSDIFYGHSELKRGLLMPHRILKTKGWNDWAVPSGLYINDFYPWSFGQFKLIRRCVSRSFSRIGSFPRFFSSLFGLQKQEERDDAIENQRDESKPLDCKAPPFAPFAPFLFASLFLWGSIGWRKGVYRYPDRWRVAILADASLRSGIASHLPGVIGVLS
jgi:hypothetical protein